MSAHEMQLHAVHALYQWNFIACMQPSVDFDHDVVLMEKNFINDYYTHL